MTMISSSSINGVPATGSAFLQTTLLRQRLRFKGVAISGDRDVQALETTYHVVPDLAGAIAMAVNAGLDIAMWVDHPEQWQANILADVREGRISQARVDEAVRQILTWKFELGLFNQPCLKDASQPCVDADVGSASVQAGRDDALQAARESIALLKNADNLLPIATNARVLVTGPNADSMVGQSGGWSVSWQAISSSGHNCCEGPPGLVPPGMTVLQGLQSLDASVVFAPSQAQALAATDSVDAIVAVVGEQAYAEGLGDNPAPALPSTQQALLDALEATNKPVIIVVMAGRPLALGARNEHNAATLMMAHQGGTQTGQAVADVIFGRVNPSGKLAVNWPTEAAARPQFDTQDDQKTHPVAQSLFPASSHPLEASFNLN